jgi:hypothetical protein
MGASTNGTRTIAPAPTREEAAAIIAAVERFRRATAPPPAAASGETRDPWSQAAILEGVEREAPSELRDPWMSA